MATDPCTILLVAGAFHTPSHMEPLAAVLRKRGHTVECTKLAGTGDAAATTEDEMKAIREDTARLIEQSERGVVVVLHSFAGRPGAAALPGLRMAERTGMGTPTKGLRGVIHLAALILSEEMARAQIAQGKQWQAWQREDEETGLLYCEGDMKAMFYHDVPEPLATELIKTLQPKSVKSLMGILPEGPRVDTAPEFDGRRGYVYCTEDAVLPIAAQQGLIAATGTSWHTRDMETSHSPFASKPGELAVVIEQLALEFICTYRQRSG